MMTPFPPYNHVLKKRMVYVIFAVGTKCMVFVWDPMRQWPGPQFWIRKAPGATGSKFWPIDPRIKIPFPASYVDGTTGERFWKKAWKLDVEERVPQGLPNAGTLVHIAEMAMIEHVLHTLRTLVILPGVNPDYFS
ncbi:hypothetical protein M011DRAFT_249050 [Sporormia fimetaria CBS 119925]|uniref:Uncharacterized protein n=1 Tax=Sporormia fimetaria CBS 119925 TaxID=1340428 RepID=A0A6A6V1A8_9PLEO|nr:hypothetical protein M011DRAFT_249050 [Sporormia fimetaria CBS 119925]